MHTTYQCPVCGFDGMDEPPVDHNICACCGTHFGYADVTKTHRELRNEWLSRGGVWFDKSDPASPNGDWDAWGQLEAVGFPYDIPRKTTIHAKNQNVALAS